MAQESKILVIGGTGYIGKYIAEASAKAGHPVKYIVKYIIESGRERRERAKAYNRLHCIE
jgi:nucleoside-diphosphate-sugar epimerase